MRKVLLVPALVTLAALPFSAAAQKDTRSVYMQIFYEGPAWLAGRHILTYSPAFRGKTGELVQEPDSTRQLAPNAILEGPFKPGPTTGYATVSTEKGTFIPDRNGKMHLETAADRKLARQQETAQFNRRLTLLDTRAGLGKSVLVSALNETAADGWEVVQMTTSGTHGGLVYPFKRR